MIPSGRLRISGSSEMSLSVVASVSGSKMSCVTGKSWRRRGAMTKS